MLIILLNIFKCLNTTNERQGGQIGLKKDLSTHYLVYTCAHTYTHCKYKDTITLKVEARKIYYVNANHRKFGY